ncbi:2-amino-4-hydroxy-6-hydroxymethyldihydropteridine diphosphokinase [Emticicia sp. 21SJ11W-3]|uniref:2-amino-4-hydroxy-6- hydroxymethyldihydropteridine diphosphokinase n=1 Tax=Emticicia sp. 21SJ11W-3 TaxID=2916755 RepID=UPI0020A1E456|nr:2-amino-4-hydroxy-6-hydroxymethyldihydropteridine diphosphokinase [Emticicia sp. 21SJ11W-3]UTA68544.1 2-amino-4-hydroxy-6-hydroxymethyldihydropteridine diphosphokinase [Emticicia sp. 21SJ11W-3]
MKINQVYLGLGSNLGNRQENLNMARMQISQNVGSIIAQSAIYETAAWGLKEQNDFLNQVICVSTTLPPHEVLAAVLAVELAMGRKRDLKWGARLIDIDVLYYNNEIIQLPELVVPHPFIQERRFVLAPLTEIAGALLHPQLQLSNAQLLEICADTSEVRKKQ